SRFADVTEDRPWIHIDPQRAVGESPFGSTVAHGYLTLSLIPYLGGAVQDGKPRYPEAKLAVNYGVNRVRFPNPVKVGSRVRAHTELAGVEEVKGGVQILEKMTVEIENEVKPACVAETVLRLYF
ncbi:MAG: MaoC family dehydratase, partial [bacterium]|nr:MaoC family dehydratase [bacterium]